MKVWMIAGTLLALLIILPALAIFFASGWVKLAGQIVLSIIFGLIAAVFLLFSYICIRAQAKKWGMSLLLAAIVLAFLIYAIWMGVPFV